MTKAPDMVFSGLYLPRPLDVAAVVGFLNRLASDRDAPRVALEVRADHDGVRHLLGCRATDVHTLRHLLTDLIPGSLLTTPQQGTHEPRPDMDTVGRLRLHPASLPLRSDVAEATTRALLSALATRLRTGEAMTLQVILGPRHAPRAVPANAVDPQTTLLQALTRGDRPASVEMRNRMKDRQSQGGFAATMRLGAVSTAQSPGVRINLAKQPARELNDVRLPWRWPLHLSVSELVGLLAWPIGDDDLPGLPPIHPRALRAAATVHTGPRAFAASAAPGDDRLIGIAPRDATYHTVAYGPSGSGKTNAALNLILADIHAGRAVAVLDPKRQLIDDILVNLARPSTQRRGRTQRRRQPAGRLQPARRDRP